MSFLGSHELNTILDFFGKISDFYGKISNVIQGVAVNIFFWSSLCGLSFFSLFNLPGLKLFSWNKVVRNLLQTKPQGSHGSRVALLQGLELLWNHQKAHGEITPVGTSFLRKRNNLPAEVPGAGLTP